MFSVGDSLWAFLIFNQGPLLFGHVFFIIFIASVILTPIFFFQRKKKDTSLRPIGFLLIGLLLFLLSLVPLKIEATGNRTLVLLPFLVLLSTIMLSRYLKAFSSIKKKIFFVILLVLFSIQLFESFSWIRIKWLPDPRQTSSLWITKHIPANTQMGIENIPIYQMIPDILLKDYYMKNVKKRYFYQIVDATAKKIPSVVVVTNEDIAEKYVRFSPTNELIQRLKREGYKRVSFFPPQFGTILLFNDELGVFRSGIIPVSSISIYQKISSI